MNRFEQAVYDCMIPTAELLEETTRPAQPGDPAQLLAPCPPGGLGPVRADRRARHDGRRACLPRHLGRESGGDHGQGRACSPSTTPSARRCCGTPTTGWPSGTGALRTRSRSTSWRAAPTCRRWATTSRIRSALYHAYSRQAFIWPYDDRARLAGEHLYEASTRRRTIHSHRTGDRLDVRRWSWARSQPRRRRARDQTAGLSQLATRAGRRSASREAHF